MANEYIPTLGEYAEIIEWLAKGYGELPRHMQRAFNDAIDRAEMRRLAQSMEDAADAMRYAWWSPR